MPRQFRWMGDSIVTLYILFSIYYIYRTMPAIYLAITPPFNRSSLFAEWKWNLSGLVIILGGHILFSVWMYIDFARRTFQKESQKVFWLSILTAGLFPFYYFWIGRRTIS